MNEKNILLMFAIIIVSISAPLASADVIDPWGNHYVSYGTSSIYFANVTYNDGLIENYSLSALLCYESPTNFQGPSGLNVSIFDSVKKCYWGPSYGQYGTCSSEGIFTGDYSLEGCYFLYRYPRTQGEYPNTRIAIFVSDLNKTFISNETILKPSNTFSAELLQDGTMNLNRLDNYSVSPPGVYENSSWGILLLPILTVIIELLTAFIFLKVIKTKKKISRILGFVLLANLISWPIAFILSLTLVLFSGLWAIILAELFAVIFEAFFIYWTNKKLITLKRAVWLSITINATSFILGILILALIA